MGKKNINSGAILIGIGLVFISFSIVSEIATPTFPTPECGDEVCDLVAEDILSCPIDCDPISEPPIICGDELCQISEGENANNCEIDCGDINFEGISCPFGVTDQCFDNKFIVDELRKKQRPLTAGIQYTMFLGENFARCSLGMIVEKNNQRFILTAGHCITDNVRTKGIVAPDSNDLGRNIFQGKVKIGTVSEVSNNVDVALISLGGQGSDSTTSSINAQTFLDDVVVGFARNNEVVIGKRVFKIGRTTGLTFGTITDKSRTIVARPFVLSKGFIVDGDNNKFFAQKGDSGAVIITLDQPHKIIGMVSAGGDGTDIDTFSHLPDDIFKEFNLPISFRNPEIRTEKVI